jgi:membrane protein
LATALWLIASLGFKYYVVSMGAYTETYGAIGAVMILMLWFYLSGLVILFGAEMNAEIEHASPYGKDPGEKVPGQKRKIGYAARRAWLDAQRADERRTSSPATSPAPPPKPLHPAPVPAGFSSLLLGVGFVAAHVWWTLKALRRPKIGA